MRTSAVALGILGFISFVNAQDANCSLRCRDQPNSAAGGGRLSLRQSSAGESLGQLVHDVRAFNALGYKSFGGNTTASLRSDYPTQSPDSRLSIGRRKFLRVCTNVCSDTQTSNEKSALQRQDTFIERDGLNRVEPKAAVKSDAYSTKKIETQGVKKSTGTKSGHEKSSRISPRKT